MPDVLVDHRIAVDETSFDFRGVEKEELEHHIGEFSEAINELRRQGLTVFVHPWLWSDLECLDGVSVGEFVYGTAATTVDRDLRLLLGVALDRCLSWREDVPGFLESVDLVPGAADDPAGVVPVHVDVGYSLGVVLFQQRRMACLAFSHAGRHGPWRIHGADRSTVVYFFTTAEELCFFWRSIFSAEQVGERDFFRLAAYAFPSLIFHPDLRFGAFDSAYRDVRDKVVEILCIINDHFSRVLVDKLGLPNEVQAALGAYGVDLSRESPNTHKSPRLMAQRAVSFEGKTYDCEWHAKLERHRNRIHFSLPSPDLGGKILVGIFTHHLDT